MISPARVESSLTELTKLGQSIWLDYIRRSLLTSGELKRLVDEGLGGVTSNPAIFEKAITGSDDYADQLAELQQHSELDAMTLYERLAVRDIQAAADTLRPVYDRTHGRDGYVSLEVSPFLANETEATISEARRLWKLVDRPNLMVKIPGTEAGLSAIQQAISEGINVNVTLLFSQERYEQVSMAYIAGLEKAADPSRIGSVPASLSAASTLLWIRVSISLKNPRNRNRRPGSTHCTAAWLSRMRSWHIKRIRRFFPGRDGRR